MLTVTLVDETTCQHADIARYFTDEHNNLVLADEKSGMVAVYAAGRWRSASLETGS